MEFLVGALGPLDSEIMIVVSRLTVWMHFEVEVLFDFVQSDWWLLAMELVCPVPWKADLSGTYVLIGLTCPQYIISTPKSSFRINN